MLVSHAAWLAPLGANAVLDILAVETIISGFDCIAQRMRNLKGSAPEGMLAEPMQDLVD